jgi:hypothetical protein
MTGNLNMNLCNITNLGADGFSFNTGTYAFSFSVTPSATITPGDGYVYYLCTASSTLTTAYAVSNIKYFAIGGGGGGGGCNGCGGGGAGGLRTNDPTFSSTTLSALQYSSGGYLSIPSGTQYRVAIGAGGAGSGGGVGANGGNTILSNITTSTVIDTAVGGGGGGFNAGTTIGISGGCGGGGAYSGSSTNVGGVGTQGYAGGGGIIGGGYGGGGVGGIGSANGGIGVTYASQSVGGGGGGGIYGSTGGTGTYGGGNGGGASATSGTSGTGGGGGGGGTTVTGGNGGSGLVIIGIPTAQAQLPVPQQYASMAINSSSNLQIGSSNSLILAPGAGCNVNVSGNFSSITGTTTLGTTIMTGNLNMNLCNIQNIGYGGFSLNTGVLAFSFSITPSATIAPLGGTYTYYIITSSCTITTTYAVSNITYLAVGGGGAGGNNVGSGGGAGGLQTNDPLLSSLPQSSPSQYKPGLLTLNGAYAVVIGSGGLATPVTVNGPAGGDTTFIGTGITTISAQGGAGGSYYGNAIVSGGCGAGGSASGNAASAVTQGYPGGNGGGSPYHTGGGGGINTGGGSSSGSTSGNGGSGLTYTVSGTLPYTIGTYGGGGGGSCSNGTAGSGGVGGGGNGGTTTVSGGNGITNSGGGGGGGSTSSQAGSGGSGIFIIGIPTTQVQANAPFQFGSIAINPSSSLQIGSSNSMILSPSAGLTISGGLSSGTVTNVLTYNASTGSVGYGTVSSGPPTSVNVFTVSGTSLALTTASAGYYYYITNTGFNALTMPGTLPTTAGTFWTLRNATSSYLSVTVANNANLTTPLILTPSNNTTIVVTVSGTNNATVSGYILF